MRQPPARPPLPQAAPGYDLVRANLAIALTDLGTLAKAGGDAARGIALYERALALAPRHADALYNLGGCRGAGLQQPYACIRAR